MLQGGAHGLNNAHWICQVLSQIADSSADQRRAMRKHKIGQFTQILGSARKVMESIAPGELHPSFASCYLAHWFHPKFHPDGVGTDTASALAMLELGINHVDAAIKSSSITEASDVISYLRSRNWHVEETILPTVQSATRVRSLDSAVSYLFAFCPYYAS
jgi:hypothetical protein